MTKTVLIILTAIIILSGITALFLMRGDKAEQNPDSSSIESGQSPQVAEKQLPKQSPPRKDAPPVAEKAPLVKFEDEAGSRKVSLDRLLREACSLNAQLREQAREQIIARQDDAVPFLAQKLKSQSHPRQTRIISELLTQIGTRQALQTVHSAIDSANSKNVENTIASGMVRQAGPENTPDLTDLIDKHPETARDVKAGRKLGQIADEYTVRELIDALQTEDDPVRRSEYMDVVSNVSAPEALDDIYNLMTTTDDNDIYRSAVNGLSSIGTHHAVALIVREMENNSVPEKFVEASKALRSVRNTETLALFEDHANPDVQTIVNETLQEIEAEEQPLPETEETPEDETPSTSSDDTGSAGFDPAQTEAPEGTTIALPFE